ncbi:M16 family metallopeptidase [Bombilactobacillus bombi]|uniref:M16 family metallopeptidase n=1 Tax=Bombilactobacillus bombi TaxID=1303590 RepID=UPI0015E607D5|nr:insulinase family protein [Bombilactobacillus bombi]
MNNIQTYSLDSGIEIWWLPTTKFHVARLECNLITTQKAATTTTRRLLANLLQRSSSRWPTASLLARELSSLYGAELTAKTTFFQNLNILSLALSAPVDYQGERIFVAAQSLLWECLTRPNLNEDKSAFDSLAFQLEQTNLTNAYASINDNYALQTSLALRKILYQSNPNLALPEFGTAQQLQELSPATIYQYYQELLSTNRLVITIVGNLDEAVILQLQKHLTAITRHYHAVNLQTHNLIALPQQLVVQERVEAIQQSQMALAYQVAGTKPVLQVLNMMLGGDDQSLLFQQVREDQGLAYSIYSNVNPYQGYLTIQAGVDASQIDKVEAIVAQQINNLAEQDLTELLKHAQLALINHRLELADNIVTPANQLLITALNTQAVLNDEQYIESIKKVDLSAIQKTAQQMQKIACYRLRGCPPNM